MRSGPVECAIAPVVSNRVLIRESTVRVRFPRWTVPCRAILAGSARSPRNATGHHIWLMCPDWDASDVLADHLADVIARLAVRPDLAVRG